MHVVHDDKGAVSVCESAVNFRHRHRGILLDKFKIAGFFKLHSDPSLHHEPGRYPSPYEANRVLRANRDPCCCYCQDPVRLGTLDWPRERRVVFPGQV